MSLEREGIRYVDAWVDLNDDGVEETIVHVTARALCGSGGGVMLILKPEASSYRVVTRTTITRPPIRVLNRVSNGWHSIGVWVQGGGIQPGYEAELPFDGKTYARNPSVPPARPLEKEAPGRVVISRLQEKKLLDP